MVLFCLLALPAGVLAADYYVKTLANGGSDANPGTSWVGAKATIQAAMDLATSTGDIVHVAAGTYNERVSFPEVNDIGLLGGYPTGGGTQAPWTNPTIIDGTGLNGSLVYFPANFSASYGYRGLVIDGFTIQNGTKNTYSGTGIESFSVDLNIKRCIIQNNTNTGGYVGGIYVAALMNESSLRILKIEECIIRNNSGPGIGGIVVDSIGSPTVELTNNLIYGNSATATGPWLYSCGGVGIGTGAQDLNSATLTNCTIADNTSAHGTAPVGGLAVNLDYHLNAVQVKNCIIWHPAIDDVYSYAIPENVNISYSDIEDSGDTGTGVIHTDPAFAGTSDYHLTSDSGDCIDGGTSVGAPRTDLEGTARPQGNGYDMGTYEYAPQAIYGDEIAVDFDTYGLWNYDGSSWTSLAGWSPDDMVDIDLY